MPTKMLPITPGEVLSELYLEPYGLTGSALAIALRIPATRVNEILRGRRAITADTALRLASYFGTTPRFWLNLQTEYDLRLTERRVGAAIREDVRRNKAVPA